ncbi:hypothetical protein V7124_23885 [Neobacillus niacini]
MLARFENEFKTYLQKKYERSFEIQEIRKGSNYLGGPTIVSAKAFPTDQKSLVFTMSTDQLGTEYSENYLAVKWSSEANALVEDKITTIFSSDVKYQYSFSVKEEYLRQEIIDEEKQNLTYALSEKNDQLVPFIQIIDNQKSVDEGLELSKLLNFIQFLRSNYLQNTRLSLEIYSSDFKKEIEENPKKFLELGDTERIRYIQDKKIIFNLLLQDTDTASIQSIEEITSIYNKN